MPVDDRCTAPAVVEKRAAAPAEEEPAIGEGVSVSVAAKGNNAAKLIVITQGNVVQVHGLLSNPELNGSLCLVEN